MNLFGGKTAVWGAIARCPFLPMSLSYYSKHNELIIFIARQHTDTRYWYSNSVCLSLCSSVRPSVCPWHAMILYENGLTYRHSFSPHGSPIILVLPASNIFTKFRRGHSLSARVGALNKYRWGIKISRFSTNKSLYLANDTRYRHGYCGRRIGTRIRSIKWCHFQWPWTNPNPVFKVTPLFYTKYLKRLQIRP